MKRDLRGCPPPHGVLYYFYTFKTPTWCCAPRKHQTQLLIGIERTEKIKTSRLNGTLIAQESVNCMTEAGFFFFQNCWLPSHFLVEVGQVNRQPRVVDNFCPHITHFLERWPEIEGCVCVWTDVPSVSLKGLCVLFQWAGYNTEDVDSGVFPV